MVEPQSNFSCVIVSPDQTLYEGQPQRVLVPGIQGDLAILPQHTPLYAELVKGKVQVSEGSQVKEFDIDGGVIRVRENSVTIVVGF